ILPRRGEARNAVAGEVQREHLAGVQAVRERIVCCCDAGGSLSLRNRLGGLREMLYELGVGRYTNAPRLLGGFTHAPQARRGGVHDELDRLGLAITRAIVVSVAVDFAEAGHLEPADELDRLIRQTNPRASGPVRDRAGHWTVGKPPR